MHMPPKTASRCWVDLAGDALSRRGYRLAGGEAPLRENLAAGILPARRLAAHREGWRRVPRSHVRVPALSRSKRAWNASDTAPGLLRDFWGFQGWRGHDAAVWNEVVGAARARMLQQVPVVVRGSDRNRGAIATAQANARRAGVGRDLVFEQRDLNEARPGNEAGDAPPGLLCVNPP